MKCRGKIPDVSNNRKRDTDIKLTKKKKIETQNVIKYTIFISTLIANSFFA